MSNLKMRLRPGHCQLLTTSSRTEPSAWHKTMNNLKMRLRPGHCQLLSTSSRTEPSAWHKTMGNLKMRLRPGHCQLLSTTSRTDPSAWHKTMGNLKMRLRPGHCQLLSNTSRTDWPQQFNATSWNTATKVAGQTCCLTQSQYTATRPTSPSTDPSSPGSWHLMPIVHVTDTIW